jgi:hypothetical protein
MALALWRNTEGEGPEPKVTGAFRLGDVRHVFASPTRAWEALGFRATVPFEDGMVELATAEMRKGRPADHWRG